MQQNLISHPQVVSAFTGRGEGLLDIQALSDFKDKSLITLDQVHDHRWQEVNKPQTTSLWQTDAVITFNPNLVLTVHVADCLPLLFFHPGSKQTDGPLIGAVHAGRKGLEKKVVSKVFGEISKKWALEPMKFLIWTGPHICFACYQIDRESDHHYDLGKVTDQQLQQALGHGCPLETVSRDRRCTLCQHQDLYSYRYSPLNPKRNQAAIALVK